MRKLTKPQLSFLKVLNGPRECHRSYKPALELVRRGWAVWSIPPTGYRRYGQIHRTTNGGDALEKILADGK